MVASFHIPPTIVLGGGAVRELAAQAQRLQARRALIVTDEFLVKSGVATGCLAALRAVAIDGDIYSGVQSDPTDRNVMDGLQAFRAARADCVIGIGGGSPIDAAKAIAVMATNEPPIAQYAGYHKIPRPAVPLMVVPTTAGTGSEATRVTIITDTDRDVKMMILDNHLIARTAIVDFELTMSMPPGLTAHVGVDTLTHGIEAFVSRRANALTDPIALSCVKLVAAHLETAYHQPGNRVAREGMMAAACQGGMAFSNSSVALVHGMSRPIGAHFHVPHGLSNAVLLPEITRYSLPGAVERYATVARTMGLATAAESDETASGRLAPHLVQLNQQLGIGRLRDVVKIDASVFRAKLPEMATAALQSGSPQNNPVAPSEAEIVELYERIW